MELKCLRSMSAVMRTIRVGYVQRKATCRQTEPEVTGQSQKGVRCKATGGERCEGEMHE